MESSVQKDAQIPKEALYPTPKHQSKRGHMYGKGPWPSPLFLRSRISLPLSLSLSLSMGPLEHTLGFWFSRIVYRRPYRFLLSPLDLERCVPHFRFSSWDTRSPSVLFVVIVFRSIRLIEESLSFQFSFGFCSFIWILAEEKRIVLLRMAESRRYALNPHPQLG